jgi:hypothetical protein
VLKQVSCPQAPIQFLMQSGYNSISAAQNQFANDGIEIVGRKKAAPVPPPKPARTFQYVLLNSYLYFILFKS